MNRKLALILTHILGSGIFLFLPVISSPDFSLDFSFVKVRGFQEDFITYLLLLGFFYINYLVLVPKLYLHKKWLLFFFGIIGCYLLIQFLPRLFFGGHFHHGHSPRMHDFQQPPGPPSDNRFPFFMGHYSFQFIGLGFFSLFLCISSRWKQIEQEKTNMELRYLRAQINPHFLFNTLNVIYASSIEEKAKKTSASLIQLSDMLRHVLNESQHDSVSLEKEIVYIRAYIALQEQRCGIMTELTVEMEGNFAFWKIPPLLLIPFIENTFKYGVSPEEKSVIVIRIREENGRLTLETHNDKVRTQHTLSEQSGIGIRNTIDRLNRLFGDDYSLEIRDKDRSFDVSLNLPLKR